jgi:purine-binding chemotaxis protein CheW
MGIRQFVTFRIDGALLGIDVLMIREINRVLDVTWVPHAPVYVRGLVNLRGQTVTVFDLGIRLGLNSRGITDESHNIILKYDLVGLIVDSIGDVVQCDESDIEAPPANVGNLGGRFIEGVIKLEGELLVTLSAAKILDHGGQ